MGLLCEKCMQDETLDPCDIANGYYKSFCDITKEELYLEKLFKEKSSYDISSLQKMWLKRFLSGQSFSMIAPTGIGKTTFLLFLGYYLSLVGKRAYFLFPTDLLLKQSFEKLLSFGAKDVLLYSSSLKKSEKDTFFKRLLEKDFSILMSTINFFYKNFEKIRDISFDFIFIDDIDSILRSSKKTDQLFELLGFTKQDLDDFYKALKEKFNLFRKNSKEDITQALKHIDKKISDIRLKKRANIIISSASIRPKPNKLLVFRELLGFEVGSFKSSLRNIEDTFEISKDKWNRAVSLVKTFGKKGIIFLSDQKESLNSFLDFLNENGIKALSYENIKDYNSLKEALEKDEIDVLVGLSSSKNPLTRGLDIPSIRYAIFVGVPKLSFNVSLELSPKLYRPLSIIFDYAVRYELFDQKELFLIKKFLDTLSSYAYQKDLPDSVKSYLEPYFQKVKETLFKEDVLKSIKEINVSIDKDRLVVITPDISAYLQGSGRTSRLYKGGLTKGLSHIIVDDEKAFNLLSKYLKLYYDIEFKPIESLNITDILKEVDKSRKELKSNFSFKPIIVVVESPNKARTIANFFGKPSKRSFKNFDIYEVLTENYYVGICATKGHFIDLNKEEGYFGVLKKKEVFLPVFEFIDETREALAQTLRDLNIEFEELLIASDPDTEGEKIGFDIFLISRSYIKNIKRIEFHEVSKKAFIEAIKNPRAVDENLVKAQFLRRISDRWIGFLVSLYLQKALNRSYISGGRVQTPVLEWIVQNFNEAKEKVYSVRFFVGEVLFEVLFESKDSSKAKYFYQNLKEAAVFIKERKQESSFVEPFTTDTLLMRASSVLRFTPKKTMELAQDLFEKGFITYHRTDSKRVSDSGILVASSYIKEKFGEAFLKIKTFSKEEGAHECIRPVRPLDKKDVIKYIEINSVEGITKDHISLYDLIFRQFIASQMKEAKLELTTYEIRALDKSLTKELITKVIEDGYNLVMPIKTYALEEKYYEIDKKNILRIPKVQYLTYEKVIKMMKDRKIGRPSTYAITIEKLLERGYIVERKGFLFPTKLGIKAIEIIKKSEDLYEFVKESFTRELEEKMDKVAQKELDLIKALEELYNALFESKPSHDIRFIKDLINERAPLES